MPAERSFTNGALWHGNALIPEGTFRDVIGQYWIEYTN
jgi:hypothetical protein